MTLLYGMAGVLVAAIAAIALVLRAHNRDRHSKIVLEDLLLGEDERISRAACVLLGAFGVTTWMLVYMTLAGKITDTFFAAYLAAWVAPAVTKLIVNASVQKAQVTPPTPDPTTVIGNSVTMNAPATPAKRKP